MNMESNSDTELTASRPMFLPCGGTAYLDPESSNWKFRCDTCFAIVGSILVNLASAKKSRRSTAIGPSSAARVGTIIKESHYNEYI